MTVDRLFWIRKTQGCDSMHRDLQERSYLDEFGQVDSGRFGYDPATAG